MRKSLILALSILVISTALYAQPYLVTATNYASGFFGVVADENGQPLEVGSVIHFIWDSAGDGMDDPSIEPGLVGMPTDDDVLMGSCEVGITGGAPSDGNFILPGTAPAENGWCYLRAFHSPDPAPGTFYSESITSYAVPTMEDPVIYGVQFPAVMTKILGENPVINVDITPDNPPIIIEPTGGTFEFALELHNNSQNTVTYDFWIDVILPNGSVYGPVLSRSNLNMPGEATWTRQLTQPVPAGAPAGIYTYIAHAGNLHSGEIIHQDGFPFEKIGFRGTDGLLESMNGWQTTGWEDGDLQSVAVPDVYFLAPPYPNPFNPTTQLRFGLPEATQVRIDVYNILGSRVTTLIDRNLPAGYHNVTWDAPNVSSGLYLVQMKAGGYVHTKKAFLLK